MKIGTYDIPDTRLHSTIIEDLKKMYNKFEMGEIDYTTLASVLGHTSAKSGTFTAKMAVMRAYNLIEGRGSVRVTDTGRKIAQTPSNSDDLNAGLIEAITSIPLWNVLFKKYTEVGDDLPTDDFWLILRQICGIPPEEAQNKTDLVRKAYLDDITDIKPPKGGGSGNMSGNQGGQQPIGGAPSIPSTLIEIIKIGNIEIKLPKEGLKEAWDKAKRIIDIYIGNE